MARRLGRDGWQGLESPQIVMKAVLARGQQKQAEPVQEELQRAGKCTEFEFTETGLDFFALRMEELALETVKKVTEMIKGMEEL